MGINRNKAIVGALLALGLAGAGGAAVAASGTVTDEAELREMRAVEGAGVTLADIVREAEARSGGRVVEAGAEDETGGVVFIVEAMKADGSVEELRYGLDGTFSASQPMDAEDADEAAPIVSAKLTLAEGIDKAIAETGGVALEAEYGSEDGKLVIEAETVDGDQLTEVAIDADTGAILEVETDGGMDDDGDDDGAEDEAPRG